MVAPQPDPHAVLAAVCCPKQERKGQHELALQEGCNLALMTEESAEMIRTE